MDEKQKDKGYVLRKLFFASLYLSTFTFGGGLRDRNSPEGEICGSVPLDR